MRVIKANDGLRDIPIMILTSSRAELDVGRAYELDVKGYLVKPLNLASFSELLAEMGLLALT